MNIIEHHIQKLRDFWGEAPEGSLKHQKLQGIESLLRTAMLEAMETVLKEAELEKDETDNSWNACIEVQIDRHTDIINKYNQPPTA